MQLVGTALAVACLLGGAVAANATDDTPSGWKGWGGSIFNTRWSQSKKISSANVASLKVHCDFTYPSGVSAPAAIHEGIAYYPTWNGSIVALNYSSCTVRWTANVSAIVEGFRPTTADQATLGVFPVSRTTPQVDAKEGVLFIGTQAWSLVVALDLATGATLGYKQLHTHEFATLTLSPTFHAGKLFLGVSSAEEDAQYFLDTNSSTYPCCSFVGAAFAVTFDKLLGQFTVLWTLPTIPPGLPTNGSGRWSGVGVWGSQPAVDEKRGQVYFGTGNIYSVPDAYLPCTAPSNNSCIPDTILTESVLAVDIATGKVNWRRRFNPYDAWTLICGVPGQIPRDPHLCPQTPGNDTDFGIAPTYVPADVGTTPGGKDIVTAGQKSGNAYALDADTGKLLWVQATSPGGAAGGMMWGVAVDSSQFYFTAINYGQGNWTLYPSGTVTDGPGFGALSLKDGSVVWSKATPTNFSTNVPPTVVGDLLLTGLTGPPPTGAPPVSAGPGQLLALNKANGAQIASFQLEGTYSGGIAVVGKYVFTGTGYKAWPGDGHFYVFKVGK